jgi:hypothetical protein
LLGKKVPSRNTCNKKGSLEITVRNEVPAKIFSLGTLFLIVNSMGTLGTTFFEN